MNRFALIVLSALVLLLSACGSSSGTTTPPTTNPPSTNPPATNTPSLNIAGTYNGTIQLDIEPFITARATFTIDSSGNVTGTGISESPTNVEGEQGTITGTIKAADNTGYTFTFDITYSSPTLGAYNNMKGNGFYSEMTKSLSVSTLAVKDSNGVYLGDAILLGTRE
ncbi:MAG: hypothetical protein ACRCYY_02630 [Trueperaceae bacterium]